MTKELKRNEELERWRQRYERRNRGGRSRMLDEFCDQYKYERKYAIKLLGDQLPMRSSSARSGPESRYEPLLEVVERIWGAAEQLCGKRLGQALGLWLPHYERHYGKLLPSQKKLLGKVSAATLDRMLAGLKSQELRGWCATKPGTLLRRHIPIQGEVWDERRPGFMEADSVAHCGASLAGNFTWSLVYTCHGSTWTEGRAVWNKGAAGIVAQTRDVEQNLPFDLLGFDFDNGSEWMNGTLIKYLQVRVRPIGLTRSRPYHKDDNAHVEQKNWMWPRQLLGYGRLEQSGLVEPINNLYREGWGPLHNFFLPSMKLEKKWRDGSRWVRRYDAAQTAYERLLESGQLKGAPAARLKDWYQSLDPFKLAAEIERRLKPILR